MFARDSTPELLPFGHPDVDAHFGTEMFTSVLLGKTFGTCKGTVPSVQCRKYLELNASAVNTEHTCSFCSPSVLCSAQCVHLSGPLPGLVLSRP